MTDNKNNKGNYIRVYNSFVNSKEGQNEYHLTTDELEVYMMIENERRLLSKEYILSVDTMLVMANKEVNKRNRKMVKDGIESLQSKGIIDVIEEGTNYYIVEVADRETLGGYEEIYLYELERLEELLINDKNKAKLIHMFCLIKVRENKNDEGAAILAYSLLADVLGITDKTAGKYLRRLEQLKIVKVGRYTLGNKKQTNKIATMIDIQQTKNVERVSNSFNMKKLEREVGFPKVEKKKKQKQEAIKTVETQSETVVTPQAKPKPIQKEEVVMSKPAKANNSARFDMNNLMDFDKPKVEEATIKASFDDGRPTAKKEMTAQEQLREINRVMQRGEETAEYRKMVREFEANAF